MDVSKKNIVKADSNRTPKLIEHKVVIIGDSHLKEKCYEIEKLLKFKLRSIQFDHVRRKCCKYNGFIDKRLNKRNKK